MSWINISDEHDRQKGGQDLRRKADFAANNWVQVQYRGRAYKNTSLQQKERELSKDIGTTLYTYQGHTHEILTLCWSPDGKYIASGGEEIHIWEVTTGTCVAVYKGHSHAVKMIKWSSDGTYIISNDDQYVHVWEVTKSKPPLENSHTDSSHIFAKIALPPAIDQNVSSSVVPIDISPDSLQIIIGANVYNPFTGNLLFHIE